MPRLAGRGMVAGRARGEALLTREPINFTADIHAVDGKPIAKRGRIPGITPNPRLKRIL